MGTAIDFFNDLQEHTFEPLQFIDAMALGFIGFSAGAKFSLEYVPLPQT